MTRYKKFLSLKELKLKMSSSFLNVFNARKKAEEFSLKDIEVLLDHKEQNWFKRTHIGRYLRIARIITSATKISGLSRG